ncbi:hypothetical protein [Salegentibacter flavus]|uniref:Uncharacterized protein n=1 Tax=Salegentibacter flavus TaxID=287099 RepID=A0A1I4XQF2_9FLAO|nr:hypothetical protein [Salegentibacter flavus]SFN28071.1 hypothetical protein SAMN05660413_00237 [Salegentibacter flavus]
MKKLLFSLLILFSFSGLKAQNLNEYKYIIIPESFEFSKEKNQHQLNSLLKFLFEREGFETLMNKESRPEDLQRDNCLGLDANVVEDSGLFTTRMRITLEDCHGNLIFTSEEGTSREKDYKTAWHESLRQAFESVEALNYNFEADAPPATPATPETAEVVEEAEVAAEVPQEEKTTPESPEKPEVVVQSEKIPEEKAPGILNFEKDGTYFQLQENENGYALFQKGMSEPFALLISSQEGGSFIYNSVTKQGIASFSENGDLVVEHFDASRGVSVKTTYTVKKD